MNFVKEYYDFKQKWYFKIGSLLFDFYICKELNNRVEKIKYIYFEDLVTSYINDDIKEDKTIDKKLKQIDYQSLNKLEYELLKHVIYVSEKYPEVKFKDSDYIYYAVLLEITISLYNSSFNGFDQNIIYNILKENLFRFEFIDFKRKDSKFNILLKYLKYINKNNNYYFSNLKNKNININITSLSNHRGYYIIEIKNELSKLLKFDEDLVDSVEKNNNYVNKLFILNFDILIQQIVYLLEKDRFSINKVIFNLDKYKYSRKSVNYLNNFDSIISKYVILNSSEKKKLDIISNKYDKCIYINEENIKKMNEYGDINILVKNSFWNKRKKDNKKLEGLKFITISDNISYKFDKEEK